MGRPDGVGEPVLRGHGEPVAARRAECGVGGDHRDRRVQRVEFGVAGGECGDLLGGGATSPNSSIRWAIQGRPVAGSTTLPAEFTRDDRADRHPESSFAEAVPSPP